VKEEKLKNSFIIQVLRRASFKWKPRYEAIKNARVSRGQYRCSMCFSACFKVKEIVVDHINPVVDPSTGWKSWDDYITRMFCGTSGFQVLCRPCHNLKTIKENLQRTKKSN